MKPENNESHIDVYFPPLQGKLTRISLSTTKRNLVKLSDVVDISQNKVLKNKILLDINFKNDKWYLKVVTRTYVMHFGNEEARAPLTPDENGKFKKFEIPDECSLEFCGIILKIKKYPMTIEDDSTFSFFSWG